MNKEKFGTFIANRRRDLGMTQQVLADQLHVTDKAVSKWERGLCYPDLTVLESLAAALGLTVAELMACEINREETASSGCSGADMRSLLEIANESQQRQKKRICRFVCLLALASVLLAGLIYLLAAANTDASCYITFVGKKANADGYFVYVEEAGRLLCLRCPDRQMYDTIETVKNRTYSVQYRWNRFTYQGILYQCEAEDLTSLGTPMDEQGSSIGIGSLLGIGSAVKTVENVCADPCRDGKYLYTFGFYYQGNHILTVENCRSTASADYDADGITELFVLTKYDEEPYMLYELKDGVIVSCFVDEVPADVLEQLQVGAPDLG